MGADLNFDATKVAPATGRQKPVPAGWYNAMLIKSEMRLTKDKTGSYLFCTFTIVDGHYVNQKLFTQLNMRNNNPVAVEIGYAELSAIGYAVGILQIPNSSILHDRPLKINVSLEPGNDQYPNPKNNLTEFRALNYDPKTATQGVNVATPAPPPAQAAQAVQVAIPPTEVPAQTGAPIAPATAPLQQPATPVEPVIDNTIPALAPGEIPGAATQPWAQPPATPVPGQQQVPAVEIPAQPVTPAIIQAQNANAPWNQPPANLPAG